MSAYIYVSYPRKEGAWFDVCGVQSVESQWQSELMKLVAGLLPEQTHGDRGSQLETIRDEVVVNCGVPTG